MRKQVLGWLLAGAMALGSTGAAMAAEDPAVAEAYGYTLDLNLDDSLQGQYEGQELTVFCCTGEFSEPLQESIDAFEKLSGAKVNLYIYGWDELSSKISMALAGDEEMDVFCFVSAYMETYNSIGELANLTELSAQYGAESYNWDGFATELLNRTSDSDGNVYGVPYQICEMMMFYRSDLMEDEAVKAAYQEATGKELAVPKTPEEMAEVAAYFTKTENEDSPTNYGFLFQGVTNAALWNWMSLLGYYGGDMFGDGWEMDFNSEAGVSAMNMGRELLAYTPSNWNEYGFDEVNTMMSSGEAMMAWNWSSAFAPINSGEVEGKIGCAVTPGASPVISGWSLGVNQLSEKQELAWKFIEFCTSQDGEMTRIDNGVSPARSANIQRMMDAGIDVDYYNALLDSLACTGTSWGDVCLPYLGAQGTSIVDTYSQSMYRGEIAAEDALANIAAELTDALATVGVTVE